PPPRHRPGDAHEAELAPPRHRRDLLAPRRRDLDLPMAAFLPRMSSLAFPRSVIWTGIALLVLWLASFGLSFVPLGGAALVVALVIAVVKAALVVAFFMELAYEPLPMKLALFSAGVLLAILIALM